MAGLAELAPELEPSPDLWERIEARLEATGWFCPSPAASKHRRRGSQLALWRALSLGSSALAAALAAALALDSWQLPHPTVATVLIAEDGQLGWLVQAYSDLTLQVTPLQASPIRANGALELWTLSPGEDQPVSLGVVPPSGRLDLPLAPGVTPTPQQFFGISLEPPEGSPVGRPTGPVLFKGNAVPTVRRDNPP